jgi:hypothetical protein
MPIGAETEADTRAMRIDPDLAANGWEGPAKTEGARVHREGYCQIKLARSGQGCFVAFLDDKTVSFSLL